MFSDAIPFFPEPKFAANDFYVPRSSQVLGNGGAKRATVLTLQRNDSFYQISCGFRVLCSKLTFSLKVVVRKNWFVCFENAEIFG